jgi:hypothetical protein
MARLIETPDGILIEVEAEDHERCAAGLAKKVDKGLEQIAPVLRKACVRMRDFWKEQVEGVEVQQVQLAFGLNFEASGSLYIAQAKAGASVTVTATLTNKPAKK